MLIKMIKKIDCNIIWINFNKVIEIRFCHKIILIGIHIQFNNSICHLQKISLNHLAIITLPKKYYVPSEYNKLYHYIISNSK